LKSFNEVFESALAFSEVLGDANQTERVQAGVLFENESVNLGRNTFDSRLSLRVESFSAIELELLLRKLFCFAER
jgi:hypothetical protein